MRENYIIFLIPDKSGARITQRRNTTFESRTLSFDDDDNPSVSTEAVPLRNRITRRRGTICEVVKLIYSNSRRKKWNKEQQQNNEYRFFFSFCVNL